MHRMQPGQTPSKDDCRNTRGENHQHANADRERARQTEFHIAQGATAKAVSAAGAAPPSRYRSMQFPCALDFVRLAQA